MENGRRSRRTAGGIVRIVRLILAAACCALCAGEEPLPLLGYDDHVVCIGDSISGQGERPGGFLRLMQEAVAQAHPGSRVLFTGLGGSGYTVSAWLHAEPTAPGRRSTGPMMGWRRVHPRPRAWANS